MSDKLFQLLGLTFTIISVGGFLGGLTIWATKKWFRAIKEVVGIKNLRRWVREGIARDKAGVS